jgi:hypothetical protein
VKSLRTYGAALAAGIMLASLLQSHAAEAGAKIPSTVPALGLLLEENFELTSMPSVVITMNDENDASSPDIPESGQFTLLNDSKKSPSSDVKLLGEN